MLSDQIPKELGNLSHLRVMYRNSLARSFVLLEFPFNLLSFVWFLSLIYLGSRASMNSLVSFHQNLED
jgi:hypothetical protein